MLSFLMEPVGEHFIYILDSSPSYKKTLFWGDIFRNVKRQKEMPSKTNVYEYTAVQNIRSKKKPMLLASTGPGGRVTRGRRGFAPGGCRAFCYVVAEGQPGGFHSFWEISACLACNYTVAF